MKLFLRALAPLRSLFNYISLFAIASDTFALAEMKKSRCRCACTTAGKSEGNNPVFIKPQLRRLLALFTDGRVHNFARSLSVLGQLGSARLTHTAFTRRCVFRLPLECVESEKRKMRFIRAKRENT
jgi:hypothetical protein